MSAHEYFSPDHKSVEKFWFGTPVLSPQAPKGQNFKNSIIWDKIFKKYICSQMLSKDLQNLIGHRYRCWDLDLQCVLYILMLEC